MSAELFPSTPYEHFELKEPVVEIVAPVETEPHPQIAQINEWLGPVALFALRHDGDLDLEAREAA